MAMVAQRLGSYLEDALDELNYNPIHQVRVVRDVPAPPAPIPPPAPVPAPATQLFRRRVKYAGLRRKSWPNLLADEPEDG